MIRLKNFKLDGFKSIKEMDLSLKSMNVLIGANGAGKSNFVSFFRMLNYMTSKTLQLYIARSGGADALLHYGVKKTKQIEFTLNFESDRGVNLYQGNLCWASGDILIFTDEQISFIPKDKIGLVNYKPTSLGGAGHRETMLFEPYFSKNPHEPRLKKTAKAICDMMSQWKVYQFHDTTETANVKQNCDIDDNRYLREDAGNLAAYLYMLQQVYPRHYKRIVSTVQEVYPQFEDFILIPQELNRRKIMLEWRQKNSNYTFKAFQMSDGTIRLISLITLLLQPEEKLPSIIILDEPELGLHPYAIEVLASLLQSVAEERQVIISTQSVALVNQFNLEDLIVVEPDRTQDEFCTSFKWLPADELNHWLERYSVGELWEKNILGGRPSL